MWAKIKPILAVIGGILLTIITLGFYTRYRDSKDEENHEDRVKADEKAKQQDYSELEEIRSDPDPVERNKRVDKWLRQGIPGEDN